MSNRLPIRDTPAMWGVREYWEPGSTAWFEYHCYEGHDSADAALWYHSHQQVTVLGPADADSWHADLTYVERQEDGMPRCYTVQFPDGFEYTAVEDELLTLPQYFWRPDPPSSTD